MRRLLRSAGAVLSVVLLSACIPESRESLSGPEDWYADTALVGTWYALVDEEVDTGSISSHAPRERSRSR